MCYNQIMFRKSYYLRIKLWWLSNAWAGLLGLFFLAVIAFTYWTNAPTFTDPDSFYHIKMTEIIMHQRQPVTDFPWLQFTTLKDAYVDHHFLYHVFLIPFIGLFGAIVGMKIATVFLAGLAIVLFYGLLRSLKIRYALIFSLLLLFTSAFSFRMGLAKAPSVAFLFLITGFFFLLKKQARPLAVLSFFFVWAYGGFILLPILTLIYSILGLFFEKENKKNYQKIILAVGGGTLLGLLIHPNFPQHFQMYWQQVIQIGLINYQNVIGVGGEWYPTNIQDLATATPLLALLFTISIITFLVTAKKQSLKSLTGFLMMLIFLIATLKSKRYIEYFVPWTYLFTAFCLQDSGALHALPHTISQLIIGAKKHLLYQVSLVLLFLYLLFIVPYTLLDNNKRLYEDLHAGIAVTKYQKAGQWLNNHVNKGDIIFNADWDDFPILFYQVPRARYIVGLDPTFMYNYSPADYQKWKDITLGETSENLFKTISQDFNSRFVLLDQQHQGLYLNLLQDPRFVLAYQDAEVYIFRVPRDQKTK